VPPPDPRSRSDAQQHPTGADRLALVTGATGYIGSRLVPRLLAAGIGVRAMSRDPARLDGLPWRPAVETVAADALDPPSLQRALEGVDIAYYLVHSLDGDAFAEKDARAARAFAAAAAGAGVQRVVYLGGMVPAGEELSEHLASRAEVGRILLDSGVPTAVLQAAVILGSGSASFEMLRYLAERLPVLVTPRWVANRIQPIAVRDVLRYLVGAADLPADVSRTFDIGGPEVLTYRELMRRYAVVAGLRRRLVVPVPVLSPALSSLWVGLVTPVPAALAKPLVRSLVNEVVAADDAVRRWIPDPPGGLLGTDAALRAALQQVKDVPADPSDDPGTPLPSDPAWSGGTVYSTARRVAAADRDPARGPRWRLEDPADGALVRLRSTRRLPGRLWLELRPAAARGGRARVEQRIVFAPRGLAGVAAWWAVRPLLPAALPLVGRRLGRRAAAPGRPRDAAAVSRT
jgi:uncharacterized protein YbjT (DUF2867 family)